MCCMHTCIWVYILYMHKLQNLTRVVLISLYQYLSRKKPSVFEKIEFKKRRRQEEKSEELRYINVVREMYMF